MKLSFAALLICFTSFSLLGAEIQEFTKTIEKEFDITADGRVSLSNKHGKLEIDTWDQNKVKVTVLIVVDTRKESDAQKVFEDINIDFSNSANSVSVETIFDRGLNNFWNKGYGEVSVDMTVTLPKTNHLNIRNRHGHTYIGDFAGEVEVNIAHGNFKGGNFTNELDFDISHGNGIIGNAKNIYADISHGKLEASNIENIEVDLSHSTLEVEDAGDVNSSSAHSRLYLANIGKFKTNRSSHDNIRIETAKSFRLNSSHTNISIKKVQEMVDVDMNHGSFETGLASQFSEVNIEGSHTGFSINVEPNASFKMDASSEHAGIRYPSGMNVNYHVEKNHNKTIKGYLGNESASSLIMARLSHGSLKVYN